MGGREEQTTTKTGVGGSEVIHSHLSDDKAAAKMGHPVFRGGLVEQATAKSTSLRSVVNTGFPRLRSAMKLHCFARNNGLVWLEVRVQFRLLFGWSCPGTKTSDLR
jgi:hypothetical protein